MVGDLPRITVITGSVREGRVGAAVARWFTGEAAKRDDIRIEELDLAEVRLPVNLDGSGDTDDFRGALRASDGFVVITPEYNHGYPGYLKIAIDTALEEWHFKPVAFVSYGGAAGGLRSVEQLRPIFAELRAVTVRETVSFPWVWDQFDEEGRLKEPDGANAAARIVLDELVEWAGATTSRRTGGAGAEDGVDIEELMNPAASV